MRAIDTNVLVRLLTRDHERQFAAADRYVKGGAWVPTLAIAEAAWVLARTYGLDREALADAVEMLLGAETLVFQDRDSVEGALAIFQAGAYLGTFLKAEIEKWAAPIKAAGVQVD